MSRKLELNVYTTLLSFCFSIFTSPWRLVSVSSASLKSQARYQSPYVAAFLYYWALTAYDVLACLLWRRHSQNSHYPAIRQSSHWRTARLLRLDPGDGDVPLSGRLVLWSIITVQSRSFQFDMPDYDALSYCWGEESPSVSLHLSGLPMYITPNLAAALANLRLQHKARYIWADQICINQASIDDKNVQVGRMGEIYANASTVVAWMGNGGDGIDSCRLLFDALQDLNGLPESECLADEPKPGEQFFELLHKGLWRVLRSRPLPPHLIGPAGEWEEEIRRHELFMQQSQSLLEDNISSHAEREISVEAPLEDATSDLAVAFGILTRLLEDLLAHVWFGRTWTLQEAVLAKRLQLHVGGAPAVSWRLIRGVISIHSNMVPPGLPMILPGGNSALKGVVLLQERFYSSSSLDHGLQSIIDIARTRQAKNARDKVYGIMGLCTSWNRPLSSDENDTPTGRVRRGEVLALSDRSAPSDAAGDSLSLPIDYGKSEEEVFVDAALACMADGSLRVLKDCCSAADIPAVGAKIGDALGGTHRIKSTGLGRPLPSWVTDWSLDATSPCASPLDDVMSIERRHRAAKDTKASPQFLLQTQSTGHTASDRHAGALLAVTGFIISPVTEVSNAVLTQETFYETDHGLSSWIEWHSMALRDSMCSRYLTEAGCLDALWRTLIFDVSDPESKTRPAPSYVGEEFESLISAVLASDMLSKTGGESHEVDTKASDELENLFSQTQLPSEPEESERRDVTVGLDCQDAPETASAVEYETGLRDLELWLYDCGPKVGGKRLRRLFRTRDGHLGNSCAHVQAGDMVAVLHGGRLPFILRPCGKVRLTGKAGEYVTVSEQGKVAAADGALEHSHGGDDTSLVQMYTLIGGECYVHGLADGQALEMAAVEGRLASTIYIK